MLLIVQIPFEWHLYTKSIKFADAKLLPGLLQSTISEYFVFVSISSFFSLLLFVVLFLVRSCFLEVFVCVCVSSYTCEKSLSNKVALVYLYTINFSD